MSDTVVFVDDEVSILNSLRRLFMSESFEVLAFTDPLDALRELEQREVSVVISDQRMPLMEGTAFLGLVKERWPDTVRIIMTGYTDFDSLTEAINRAGIHRFIAKPWDQHDLMMVVRSAIDHYRLLIENKRLLELTTKQNRELTRLTLGLEKKVAERTAQLTEREERIEQTLEKLRKALGGTVQAIARTVEARDPYTAGHQRAVAELSLTIAKEMRLSQEQIDAVMMAGQIHDLGKVSIPAEILSKTGKLAEHEFDLIKTHTTVGHEILKDIELPWPVADIVFQHHERMDGSGYPQGLSGEAILVEARIIAVADVVEAMCAHRPYRPALGLEKAVREIEKNKGILYDREVVDACLKVMNKKDG